MIIAVIIALIIFIIWYILNWSASDLDYIYGRKTIYFGHRGERHAAPENTLISYLSAINNGLTGLELDVRITKDGKLVCSHNVDLERETLGSGYIDELNYVQVAKIKVGREFSSKEQGKIPLLEDVLNTIPKNILLNIEVKSDYLFDIRAAKELAKLLKNNEINHIVLVSSFNPVVVRYIKIKCKNVPIGYIYEESTSFKGVFIARPDCLHPDAEFIDDKLIKFCRKRKMRINTWTVNNSYAKGWLIKKGIDGIITDNPRLVN